MAEQTTTDAITAPTDERDASEEHTGDEATVADVLEGIAAGKESSASDRLDSPHRARIVVVPLVAALIFFFGPALAFLLGDRAEEIDNRPLASMPTATDGWSFFPDFTTWANDHLPLRSQAVEGGTELSQAVFDEPPPYGQAGVVVDGVQYPRVIEGSDGWLYFGGDVSGPCAPKVPIDDVVQSFRRLHSAIEESGRSVVFVLVPDKSTMVPEHLPDRFAGEACAAERKEATWDAVTSAGLPLIDMRGPLADRQESTGNPLYRKTDSHWNLQGASTFVEEVVNHLDPGMLAREPEAIVHSGEIELRGDLGAMLGTPTREPVVDVRVVRPGVTLSVDGQPIEPSEVPPLGPAPRTVDGSSTGPPLFQGRTVILGDSFFASARPLFAPFFDNLALLHNQSDATTLASTIADSDTIVIELVERSVAGGDVQLGTPAVVDVVEQALAADP